MVPLEVTYIRMAKVRLEGKMDRLTGEALGKAQSALQSLDHAEQVVLGLGQPAPDIEPIRTRQDAAGGDGKEAATTSSS